MDPENPISIADVVISTAGRDQGELFYVADINDQFVTLVNGKNRPVEKPKRKKRKHVEKVLRSETRVAEKIRSGDKVLNGELRRDLASLSRAMQGHRDRCSAERNVQSGHWQWTHHSGTHFRQAPNEFH